ncbi:MAG: DUF3737 family protein [Clostridia bacterium]|nr:DUF3737 family protein [Clostridia bacterium]
MERFENLVLDEERALYGLNGAEVVRCVFEGPADGESALKECRNVHLDDCDLRLRYPLWHVTGGTMKRCRMTDTCRAALWYDEDMTITDCAMNGIKALRECRHIAIEGGSAESTEFGWMCHDLKVKDFTLTSEYPFLHTTDAVFDGFTLHGKYSFQYTRNLTFRNCVLNTKDAFWHAENITVYDSVVKGEYLAWYSTNLRLVRCRIIGTQPLCYCKGLVLEDCTMEGCDLSFENSDVQATVNGHIDSVKNPVNGFISADSIGEIILDAYKRAGECPITIRKNQGSIA